MCGRAGRARTPLPYPAQLTFVGVPPHRGDQDRPRREGVSCSWVVLRPLLRTVPTNRPTSTAALPSAVDVRPRHGSVRVASAHARAALRPRGRDPGHSGDPGCRGHVAKTVRLLEQAAAQGVELAVLPETFVPLYPSNRWAKGAADVRRLGRAVGAAARELGRGPGPAGRRAGRGVRAARTARRGRHQRARRRLALQRLPGARADRAPPQAPQADADAAGAAVPRHRGRRRPRAGRYAGRPRRRPDLLGEPDAARALGGLPGLAADLGRPDRRRLGRLAGLDAAHRDRVGRVRDLGAAVHPRQRVPGRLPGRDRPRRDLRPRRRRDRRADGRAT